MTFLLRNLNLAGRGSTFTVVSWRWRTSGEPAPPTPLGRGSCTRPARLRVLLIDHRGEDAVALAEILEQASFRTTLVPSPDDATSADVHSFSAVTLGTGGPLPARIEWCRSLREQGYTGAILVACDDAADAEALLDAGADDFVASPLKAAELGARLRASIRRSGVRHRLQWGHLELDRVGRLLHLRGQSIALTARECELLARLIEAGGRVVSRDTLRKQIWPSPHNRGNLVEVFLSRLRDKLGDNASIIETVRGAGYRLRQ